MSGSWDGQALLPPISADQPCGENLENSTLFSTFDALRLFGQSKSPEAPPDPDEHEKETEKARAPIEWAQLRSNATEALAKSRDLRLLVYLATALLRTDGLTAFAQTLPVAAHWLDTYWLQLYPLIDEDAIARRNALNCFADPMAVGDRIWRIPLVASRQHGKFCLRDIEMATGQIPVGPKDKKPDDAAIRAAFAEMPIEELTALDQHVAAGAAAMHQIDSKLRAEGGPEMAPDFGPLLTQFAKLGRIFKDQLAARGGETDASGLGTPGEPGAAGAGYVGGVIRSRQEAIKALEAVAAFFRGNEPSSPVPMIVDRAKRLVAKDFLEVLADIAPDAVGTARSAGGLKDQQQ